MRSKKPLTPFKISVRVRRIEKRQKRSYIRAPSRWKVNASHARELIGRKVALPELKKMFGKSLKAVLIFGSAQQGVRAADTHKWDGPSDVDIVFILEDSACREMEKKGSGKWAFRGKRGEEFDGAVARWEKSCGTRIDINPEPAGIFKERIERQREPFQTIFGKEWIQSELGEETLKKMGKWKENYLREHPKMGSLD
jgi:hypothetical protein